LKQLPAGIFRIEERTIQIPPEVKRCGNFAAKSPPSADQGAKFLIH